MAEAAVETRITEAGSVDTVAAATVGTVTFLVAGFSIQSLGAAWKQMVVSPRVNSF